MLSVLCQLLLQSPYYFRQPHLRNVPIPAQHVLCQGDICLPSGFGCRCSLWSTQADTGAFYRHAESL